jgi:sugar lactone lactonase YvrE
MRTRIVALFALAGLAGCTGGSHTVVPPSSVGTPASKGPSAATATFKITIPARSATAAARTPHYVSAATQSIVITLTTVNGATFTGTPASIASNLTTSNPACTGIPLTCTVVAPAAVGNDAFTVATYDAQQTSASPASPTGQLLSQATVTVAVAASQPNVAPPLVLNGVAASITLSPPAADPHILGTPSTRIQIIGNQPYTFTVNGRDADGNIIVDPGSPTFTMQSSSSAVVITPVAGGSNAYAVQARAYSASPVTLSVTGPNGTPTLTVTVTTVQELWVANPYNSTITAYAGTPPTRITADTISAGLLGPKSLAFDAHGVLWVANYANVTAYSGTTQIAADTITAGLSAPSALTFDANGLLWVGDWPSGSPGSINAYSGATQVPGSTITNPQGLTSGLYGPRGLAFDASGNLWVGNGGGNVNTVTVYAGATQLGASTITGLAGPFGLAFDGSGHLWVSNANTNAIAAYTGTAQIPGTTITSGLNQPSGLAFDASGHLWVANSSTGVGGNTVTEYASTSQIAANTITAGLSGPMALVFAPSGALPASTLPPPPGATPTPTPTPVTPTPTPTPPISTSAAPTPTPPVSVTPTPTPTPTSSPPTCSAALKAVGGAPVCLLTGFLAFPLTCGAPLINGVCNSHPYDGPYTAARMWTVLDHSLVKNPLIHLNANYLYQYGQCDIGAYPNCQGLNGNAAGGDGKVVAFNGETASGSPNSTDRTCIAGNIKLASVPNAGDAMVIQPSAGCNYLGSATPYASYDEHPGYDYYADIGTPVYASAAGQIVNNGDTSSGYASARCVSTNLPGGCAAFSFVGIDHGNGYVSQYGHLSDVDPSVRPGAYVAQGQLIGHSGWTGLPRAADAHLHFEVIAQIPNAPYPSNRYSPYNWAVVDPYGWIPNGPTPSDPLYSWTIYGIPHMKLWQ